jgi:hypothetical protein
MHLNVVYQMLPKSVDNSNIMDKCNDNNLLLLLSCVVSIPRVV